MQQTKPCKINCTEDFGKYFFNIFFCCCKNHRKTEEKNLEIQPITTSLLNVILKDMSRIKSEKNKKFKDLLF